MHRISRVSASQPVVAALVVAGGLAGSTYRPPIAPVPVPAAASAAVTPAGVTPAGVTPAGTAGGGRGRGGAADHAGLRRVLREAVRQGAPGAIAQVRQDGAVTILRSGVADRATGQRPRPDMRFRIGSITKTFLATVVLQLVHEGRLDLGETVAHRLPGLVRGNGNDGRRVTLRMLLDQTSGLFDYRTDPTLRKLVARDRFRTFTPHQLVRFAVRHRPLFAPGTGWAYSDTNYLLLGMVVRAATGHPYAAEITRRIIRPLHLRETYLPGTSPDVRPPHLHGYTRSGTGRIEDVTRLNPSYLSGSDMISTTGDLVRFDTALLGGRLLPPALLRQMLAPTPGSDVVPGFGSYRYGFGIVIGLLPCGRIVYGNAGRTPGSDSYVMSTRDGRHAVSFDLTGDWVDQAALTARATNAEFCPGWTVPSGRAPGTGR